MDNLVILGLVVCCLLGLLVIAYLVRALEQSVRRQYEPRAPEASPANPQRLDRQTQEGATTSTTGGGGVPTAVASNGAGTNPPGESLETHDAALDSTTEARRLPVDESAAGINPRAGVVGVPHVEAVTPVDAVSSGGGAGVAAGTTAGAATVESVEDIARGLEEFFNQTAHPKDLLRNEKFLVGVEMLRSDRYTTEDLLDYSTGANAPLASMALEALSRRADAAQASRTILGNLNTLYWWPRFYALRVLHAAHDAHQPILVEVLLRVESIWADSVLLKFLRDFVSWRVGAGEAVTFGERLDGLTEVEAETLESLLEGLGESVPVALSEEFEQWQKERVDFDFLRSFGRVWEAGGGSPDVLLPGALAERVAQLETALRKDPPRSLMLVGERGVGKTTLVRALSKRLQKERWTVFEAGAADIIAGQMYIGQIEGRVQSLVRKIGGKRVLWFIPNFHELVWAGRHDNNPTSVLDQLLPQIESGALKVVGETSSVAYEKLVQLKPQLRNALETCRVNPLPDAETLALARQWAARSSSGGDGDASGARGDAAARPRIDEETLQEAFQLARQYLGDRAAPGNLLDFLDSTHRRLAAASGGDGRTSGHITLDDLLVTLAQLTGLPTSMLDERSGIDLEELRGFFGQRVLGQPEAVECLVERVAMIKAGLTDPTRPQGVFLFVGPTGTGKTEIAKTLAEFLFGSPERMIRLDMSEFQTPDSLDRILGESSATSDSTALVNAIRKQPFSVVLLDEFEKANPNVWDLFLQVFDDGRLTDRRGNTADFRHCVVILTSNLGATLPAGVGIGFSQEQAGFAPASVERAVTRAFRREFINRIDRVVVFRPLGRAVMRELLRKELNDVLRRRGLRTRAWAVEWDESAIEFLLQRGFTPDLGARPLKRAVERYLLSPLALTIVNHQFPEGDQFLFVRSPDGERLDVVFVDPDAPEQPASQEQPTEATSGAHAPAAPTPPPPAAADDARELSLQSIMLDARGTIAEVEFLQDRFRGVEERVDDGEWQRRKDDALAQTTAPDFWTSPGRFSVLGVAEYMDRIEAGLATAGSLLNRLNGSRPRDRRHFPPELVSRLAEQLYLIDAACRGLTLGQPRDAFLQLRANCDAATDAAVCNAFAARLAAMYKSWAKKRRMHFDVLEETGGEDAAGVSAGGAVGGGSDAAEAYRLLLAVSGFAAYAILQPETGLHVLETPQDEKSFNRARVQVRVVAQPEEPAGHGREALRTQAMRVLAADNQHADNTAAHAAATTIVRRYREEPSPLVRDSVRQWRTGRLDRVLSGDFDIIT